MRGLALELPEGQLDLRGRELLLGCGERSVVRLVVLRRRDSLDHAVCAAWSRTECVLVLPGVRATGRSDYLWQARGVLRGQDQFVLNCRCN